jgi:hypothetical protein
MAIQFLVVKIFVFSKIYICMPQFNFQNKLLFALNEYTFHGNGVTMHPCKVKLSDNLRNEITCIKLAGLY